VCSRENQLVRTSSKSRENQLKELGKQEHKLRSEIEERQVKLRSLAKKHLDAEKLLTHYKSIGQEERGAGQEMPFAFPGTPGGTNTGAALLPPWAPLKTQDGFGGVEVIRGNKVIRRFTALDHVFSVEVRCESAQKDHVFSNLTAMREIERETFITDGH
jgi:hypothetical protein